jgi:hypothetical protein
VIQLVKMQRNNSKPTMLDYAERTPRLSHRFDFAIGVVGVTIVFPLAGFIAYEAIRMSRLSDCIIFLVTAIVAFGFGILCIATAIRAWTRRNLIEPPPAVRFQSLNWQCLLPVLWLAICLLHFRDLNRGVDLHRMWMVLSLLLAAKCVSEI